MRQLILIGLFALLPISAQAAFRDYTVVRVTRVTRGGVTVGVRVTVRIEDTVLSKPAVAAQPAVLDAQGNVVTPPVAEVPEGPTRECTYTLDQPAELSALVAAAPGAARMAALDGIINAPGGSWITRDYRHWVGTELAPAPVSAPADLATELGSAAPSVTVAN